MMYTTPVSLLNDPAGLPPWPQDAFENTRWDHTRRARRLLTGLWREDLVTAIRQHFPIERQEATGIPDLSSNILKAIATQLSVLHDREPKVGHPNEAAAAGLIGEGGALYEAGWAPLMQRFATHVIGLRENLMHAAVSEEGVIQLRPVAPDMVIASASPWAPDVPTEIRELRLRSRDMVSPPEWVWDTVSIADPENPFYRVHSTGEGGEVGEDISGVYLKGNYEGDNYPHRKSDGTPVLPYILYHAAKLGDSLWDPFDLLEVIEGTFTAAVLQTFLVHVMRDASWPQRAGVDVRLKGGAVESAGEQGARSNVVSDPSTILMFESEGDAQALLHQFGPGADPEVVQRTAENYERRVAEQYGLSPSDMQRLSGNARSGYAIALTNAAKREAQRRFTPQFRVGDTALFALCAILSNRAAGTKYPEEGYTVEYGPIPLSDQEREAQTKDIELKMRLGLMSAVDAYIELHPGTTREGAIKALQGIRNDNARLQLEAVTQPRSIA